MPQEVPCRGHVLILIYSRQSSSLGLFLSLLGLGGPWDPAPQRGRRGQCCRRSPHTSRASRSRDTEKDRSRNLDLMNVPCSWAELSSAWAQWRLKGQEARTQQGWGSASHGLRARRNSKSTIVLTGIICISSRLGWNFIIIFILLQWRYIRDIIEMESDIQIWIHHVRSVLCYPLLASCMTWLNNISSVFYPYFSLLPWASLLAWILWTLVRFFQPVSEGKHRHTKNRLPMSLGSCEVFIFYPEFQQKGGSFSPLMQLWSHWLRPQPTQ